MATDYSYFGRGKVYVREVGSAAGLIEVGNCSALAAVVNEQVFELQDYTDVGGGTRNEIRRIQSVEIQATLTDLSPENLARAILGDASAITAITVTDEEHTAYPLAFVPTTNPGTVTSVTGLTVNTHYTVVPGGIQLLEAAPIDYMGEVIEITYSRSAANAVEALLNSSKEYEFFFSGLNEARSGKQATFEAYRWKMGPATNLPLIAEEYATLVITGKLLKDTTKNGTTESQYFRQVIVT